MSTERLFVAIDFPPPVRAVLESLVSSGSSGIHWTPPEQLHLTLRFLGDVEREKLPTLIERLRSVQVAKFLLPVEGAGSFPPNRPARVVWVGVGHGHPLLFQLQQKIDDAILACGVPLDVRHFSPHVTLGRCGERSVVPVHQWLKQHHDFAGPTFEVTAFSLYASELRPTGAVHRRLEIFPLVS